MKRNLINNIRLVENRSLTKFFKMKMFYEFLFFITINI